MVATAELSQGLTEEDLRRQERAAVVENNEAHALMGRRAVDLIVVTAVSNDDEAFGRVAGTFIDQVKADTGPVNIVSPEDEIRVLEAATKLAREVEKPARDETIVALKAKIEQLEKLVSADVAELTDTVEKQRHRIAGLTNAVNDKDDLIGMLRDDKARRDLADYERSQTPTAVMEIPESVIRPEVATISLRQRMMVGVKSVTNFFASSGEGNVVEA